ncbi:hypothetical protein [Oceaniglobus trochenteri]|uniref:hypothetical protein n=1 Tax=Oceaniglobus trochenteri TaxID=2763260 RepID=UPI001CFF920C|nr:hypothetical protein [Oceaniglobus trochenteri]
MTTEAQQAAPCPDVVIIGSGVDGASAAVNPALTVAAQALRVGAHLGQCWHRV